MDVFEAVRTVLAVRQYQDKPVPQQTVKKIVEAAHLAASSMNLQPWHFVLVQERSALQELGKLVKTGPYIAQAPLAVAVAVERDSKFAISDASRAVQSMILAAWEDGVGSNWAGFGGLEDARKFLAVPDQYDVLAVIPFGYPADPVGRGKKKRKPLGEVVSKERHGQPFS
jgi:nitroreductase